MIVDVYGKPLRHVAYGRYGASVTKKSLRSFIPSSKGPDEDITRNLDILRARSRDLFQGSPLATGALKTLRTNVVGSGLMLNPHIDSKFLKLSEEEAQD